MRSNVWNVVGFEIRRNLKKPTFWIAALLLPALLIGYIALAGAIGYNAGSAIEEGADLSGMSIGVYDEAKYLEETKVTDADGNTTELEVYDSAEKGIEDVKSGKLGVFYHVPADFAESLKVHVYSRPDTTSVFASYDGPLRTLLATSAQSHVDAVDFAVITNAISVESTNFSVENADEVVDPSEVISRMIVPGVGLVLFYILIVMFGNRLTTAMVEEKENRISEIILTSMSPKDLITGKIISLIALGFIQLGALIVPIIILYMFGATQGIIPEGIMITWDAWTIISSLILLLVSYFLFTALCITIGTLVPTAKDASSFASVIMILVILPLFFISTFMSETPSAITYVLSYFPPSAPIALMFRNVFGTLPVWELILGVAIMAIVSALIIKLAVWIFKRSALEFTAKISLKSLLAGPRKNWKDE